MKKLDVIDVINVIESMNNDEMYEVIGINESEEKEVIVEKGSYFKNVIDNFLEIYEVISIKKGFKVKKLDIEKVIVRREKRGLSNLVDVLMWCSSLIGRENIIIEVLRENKENYEKFSLRIDENREYKRNILEEIFKEEIRDFKVFLEILSSEEIEEKIKNMNDSEKYVVIGLDEEFNELIMLKDKKFYEENLNYILNCYVLRIN